MNVATVVALCETCKNIVVTSLRTQRVVCSVLFAILILPVGFSVYIVEKLYCGSLAYFEAVTLSSLSQEYAFVERHSWLLYNAAVHKIITTLCREPSHFAVAVAVLDA